MVRPKSNRSGLKQQLGRELKAMRLNFNEIAERHTLKVNSQFAEILRILENERVPGERVVMPSEKACKSMVRKLVSVKVKPGKARLKDLARISMLADDLSDMLPDQP